MMVPAMVNVLRVSDFNGRAFGAALDAVMGRRVKTINDTVMVCHAFMLIELSGVHVLADCEVDATIPATRGQQRSLGAKRFIQGISNTTSKQLT